jgi:hypothetical protein
MRLPASTAIGIHGSVCAGGAMICLRLGAAALRAHSVPQVVHPAPDAIAGGDRPPDSAAAASLAALAYELLDAHTDTAQLAEGLPYDRSWAAHLDYLRALQRTGRQTLARTAPDELSFDDSEDSRWHHVC